MIKKKNVPSQILSLVRQGRVYLSRKALNQEEEGWYTAFDLEHSLLHGQVIKKEKDETGETKYKYVIEGPALNGDTIYSCGKVIKRGAHFYFVLTFHKLR